MRRLIVAAGLLLAAFVTPAVATPIPAGTHGLAGTAFVYKNGVFTLINQPALFSNGAGRLLAMNNNGIAVGIAGIQFQSEGLVYDTNTGIQSFFDVPAPNLGLGPQTALSFYVTQLDAIDDAGDVAGFAAPLNRSFGVNFTDIGGVISSTAFFPAPGNIGLLGGAAPSFDPTRPNIQTITTASLPNGTAVGYLLVPEPSPLSLMTVALMMLGALSALRWRLRVRSLR